MAQVIRFPSGERPRSVSGEAAEVLVLPVVRIERATGTVMIRDRMRGHRQSEVVKSESGGGDVA